MRVDMFLQAMTNYALQGYFEAVTNPVLSYEMNHNENWLKADSQNSESAFMFSWNSTKISLITYVEGRCYRLNTPKRMEIYYAKLIKTKGSVQYGRRPVLVVSNDVANRFAETVVVVPMTSRQKNNIPTHIVIDLGGRKSPRSTIMCEQVRTIST